MRDVNLQEGKGGGKKRGMRWEKDRKAWRRKGKSEKEKGEGKRKIERGQGRRGCRINGY